MAEAGDKDAWKKGTSIYDFSAKDIDGKDTSLDKYKGQVCLIVNVASKWGFTKQYGDLQAMHDEFAERGLRVLGFPCNQFGSQEPLSEPEIKEFVTGKYKVTFDLYSKINVNGDEALPLYKYLKSKQGGFLGSFIKWNFTKFLVDRQGIPVKRYSPNSVPNSFKKDVEHYLEKQ